MRFWSRMAFAVSRIFEVVSTADANAMQENLNARDAFTSDDDSTLECGSTVEP